MTGQLSDGSVRKALSHNSPGAPLACRRGVVVAGVVFGALHNNGGRNPAFAAWAAAVGCAYGWLLLATQSVYSPMLAHSVANLASATLWLSDASSGGGSTQQPGAER